MLQQAFSLFPTQTFRLDLLWQILSVSSAFLLQVHFPGKERICQASSVLERNLDTLRCNGPKLTFESGVSTQQGLRRGLGFPLRSSTSLPFPFLIGNEFLSVHEPLHPPCSPLFQFRLHLSLTRCYLHYFAKILHYPCIYVTKTFLSLQNLLCLYLQQMLD